MPLQTNGIYVVMFYGNFVLPGWNDPSANGFCGYHTVYPINAGVKVAVVGDSTTAVPMYEGCMSYFGRSANNDISADNLLSVYTHEVIEIVTDSNGNLMI